MPDEPKKTRQPLKGMALQTDIIKKIGAQLERINDAETASNILDFMQRAVRKKLLAAMTHMGQNGQVAMALGPHGVTGTEDAEKKEEKENLW